MEEEYKPVAEWSETCTPVYPPKGGNITITCMANITSLERNEVSKEIGFVCLEELMYLIRNVEIKEGNRLNEAVTSNEALTVVSDGGLKLVEGFGWVLEKIQGSSSHLPWECEGKS